MYLIRLGWHIIYLTKYIYKHKAVYFKDVFIIKYVYILLLNYSSRITCCKLDNYMFKVYKKAIIQHYFFIVCLHIIAMGTTQQKVGFPHEKVAFTKLR